LRDYGVAVLSGSAVVLLRLPLTAVWGYRAPFLLASPGIIVAAFVGGFWPALFVSLVGFLVGVYVSAGGPEPVTPVGGVIYAAFCLVFAAAGALRQRGLRRARQDAQRLDDMQRRLQNVARLNAAGEMAGTLAHELNQPLTAIASYLGAARRLLGAGAADPRLDEILQKASDQAVRAGQIVSRTREFVRRGAPEQRPEDLPDLLREAGALAGAAGVVGAVDLRFDFDRAVVRALADRVQIQQVVLNLVRNAAEAVADSPRRQICIGLRARDARLAEVSVADTGPGVSPELAERLFQPFVTTKDDGMGVGLSISRSIVEAHGGKMWMETNADGGATFLFTLQRADPE
jgi:two-component system sensor kinase FixL